MIFASSGYKVQLFDAVPENIQKALETIKVRVSDLESKGLLRGELTASQQVSLISGGSSAAECLKDAFYCQVIQFRSFLESNLALSPGVRLREPRTEKKGFRRLG